MVNYTSLSSELKIILCVTPHESAAKAAQRQATFLKPHPDTVTISPTSRKYVVNSFPKNVTMVRSGFEPGNYRSRSRRLYQLTTAPTPPVALITPVQRLLI